MHWDFPGGPVAPKSLWMVITARKLKDTCSFGRKAMTNLDSILKSRDITLLTKVHVVKTMIFPVVQSQRRDQQGNSENGVHALCLQAPTLPHNGVLRKGSGHPPGAPGRLPGCTLEEKTPRRKVPGKRYSEEWRQRAFSRHFRNPGLALQPVGL